MDIHIIFHILHAYIVFINLKSDNVDNSIRVTTFALAEKERKGEKAPCKYMDDGQIEIHNSIIITKGQSCEDGRSKPKGKN